MKSCSRIGLRLAGVEISYREGWRVVRVVNQSIGSDVIRQQRHSHLSCPSFCNKLMFSCGRFETGWGLLSDKRGATMLRFRVVVCGYIYCLSLGLHFLDINIESQWKGKAEHLFSMMTCKRLLVSGACEMAAWIPCSRVWGWMWYVMGGIWDYFLLRDMFDGHILESPIAASQARNFFIAQLSHIL